MVNTVELEGGVGVPWHTRATWMHQVILDKLLVHSVAAITDPLKFRGGRHKTTIGLTN